MRRSKAAESQRAVTRESPAPMRARVASPGSESRILDVNRLRGAAGHQRDKVDVPFQGHAPRLRRCQHAAGRDRNGRRRSNDGHRTRGDERGGRLGRRDGLRFRRACCGRTRRGRRQVGLVGMDDRDHLANRNVLAGVRAEFGRHNRRGRQVPQWWTCPFPPPSAPRPAVTASPSALRQATSRPVSCAMPSAGMMTSNVMDELSAAEFGAPCRRPSPASARSDPRAPARRAPARPWRPSATTGASRW